MPHDSNIYQMTADRKAGLEAQTTLYKCRRELNRRIDKNLRSASFDHVKTVLDPILKQWNEETTAEQKIEPVDPHNLGPLLPLIYACDIGLVEVVRYLTDRCCGGQRSDTLVVNVVGRPTETSLAGGGVNNTAVHHAAASGLPEILEELVRLHRHLSCNDLSVPDTYQALAVVQNDNLDNPLMVAAAGGKIDFVKQFLLNWGTPTNILDLLARRNREGHSLLSLATALCHVDLVELLVFGPYERSKQDGCDSWKSPAQFADVQKAEVFESMFQQELKALEKHTPNRQALAERRERHTQCREIVKESYRQKADEMATFLLERADEMNDIGDTAKGPSGKKKGKRKSRKKGKPDTKTPTPNTPNRKDDPAGHTTENKVVAITQLPNGSRAVTVKGVPEQSTHLGETNNQPRPGLVVPKTPDELLQDRDVALGGMLDSLSLKASMLLWTSHAMALQLSPSQIDGVEYVMRQQLAAVQEARAIQGRVKEIVK